MHSRSPQVRLKLYVHSRLRYTSRVTSLWSTFAGVFCWLLTAGALEEVWAFMLHSMVELLQPAEIIARAYASGPTPVRIRARMVTEAAHAAGFNAVTAGFGDHSEEESEQGSSDDDSYHDDSDDSEAWVTTDSE